MKSVRLHDSKLKFSKALLLHSFHETEAPTAFHCITCIVEGRTVCYATCKGLM